MYKAKVKKRIFISEDNTYAVFSAYLYDEKKDIVIVGNIADINPGEEIEFDADLVEHKIYGTQFKVQDYRIKLPDERDGIIAFLSSGRFKGIGKKTAEKIVDKFGKDTFEILENEPERLHEIKGIRKSIIEEIKKFIVNTKTIREIMIELKKINLGRSLSIKIYEKYGEDSLLILKHDPYRLIDDISGIGFKIADRIAISQGISVYEKKRIRNGIKYIFKFFEEREGHLYISFDELYDKAIELLEIEKEYMEEILLEMINKNEIIKEFNENEEEVLIIKRNFIIENYIASKLLKISESQNPEFEINFEIEAIKSGLKLTETQKQAINLSINSNLTIITGGPGSGKTTIIKIITEILDENHKSFKLCAPTGRAAKRMEEVTGFESSTIHRMLRYNPQTGGFELNEENPLETDYIIIDEFSMVDVFLFYNLLKALKYTTKIIIIGDKDQLPSIGPGNVLRDMINSNIFNTIYLDVNFRQSEESLIIENAYRVNKGEELIIKPYEEGLDFIFINTFDCKKVIEKIRGILNYYKDEFEFNSFNYQILIPMYRGECGITRINELIQEEFNDNQYLIKSEGKSFKLYDKVLQLKNDYTKDVFNGDQGIIIDYDLKEKKIIVDFLDNIVSYKISELDEITLSYSTSIHKAQGSEYDFVVLVLLSHHHVLLNREILYTAITRAKKKLILLSNTNTINYAINNSNPSQRRTLLKKLLINNIHD